VVVLLLTICSTLDVRGRWNAAIGGALGFGTAIGPLIAGAALDVGYLPLALVLLSITVVAVILLAAVALQTDRASTVPAAAHVPVL